MAVTIRELAAMVTADTSGLTRGVNRGIKETNRLAAGISSAGARMGAAFSRAGDAANALGVAVGAVAATVSGIAVKKFASFEATMKTVGAVTRTLGTKDFALLEQAARKAGQTTQFTAQQSAEAMEQMGLAGLDAQEVISALPKALELAASGGVSIAEAAEIAAKNMRAWGEDAEGLARINDVMVATFTNANITIRELSAGMRPVAPVARAVGESLEDTAAIIAKMSDANIDARTAGTALRNALIKLSKPTDDAQKLLDKMGVKVRGANGKLRPMLDILSDMEGKLTDVGDAATIFGVRGGPQMQALLNEGIGSVRELADKLENSAGVSADIMSAKLDTLEGDTKLLLSAIDDLFLTLGKKLAPGLRKNVKAATELVVSFGKVFKVMTETGEKSDELRSKLTEQEKKILKVVETVTGAATSLLDSLSPVEKKVLAVTAAMTAASGAVTVLAGPLRLISPQLFQVAVGLAGLLNPLKLVGVAITAITSPFGLAAAAVAGVGAAVLKLTGNWERFIAFMKRLAADPVATGKALMDTIKQKWEELSTFFQAELAALRAIWERIKEVFAEFKEFFINEWIPEMRDRWTAFHQTILGKAREVWPQVRDTMQNALTVASNAITPIVEGLRAQFDRAWNNIGFLTNFIWPSIQQLITTTMNTIWGIIKPIVTTIGEFWAENWQRILTALQNVLTPLLALIGTLAKVLAETFSFIQRNVIQPFLPVFEGLFKIMFKSFEIIIDLLALDFKEAWNDLLELFSLGGETIIAALKGIVDSVVGAATDIAVGFIELGKALVDAILTGIKAGWGKVTDFFANSWKSIKNKFNPFAKSSPSMVDNFRMGGDTIAGILTSVADRAEGTWQRIRRGSANAAVDMTRSFRAAASNIGAALGSITGNILQAGVALAGGSAFGTSAAQLAGVFGQFDQRFDPGERVRLAAGRRTLLDQQIGESVASRLARLRPDVPLDFVLPPSNSTVNVNLPHMQATAGAAKALADRVEDSLRARGVRVDSRKGLRLA